MASSTVNTIPNFRRVAQLHPFVNAETRRLAHRARWDSAVDERLTRTVFWDLWHLDVSFRLDFEGLLRHLERLARQP